MRIGSKLWWVFEFCDVWLLIQVETLSREDLASRLTLNVDAASVGSLLLSDSYITIMDVSYLKFVCVHVH